MDIRYDYHYLYSIPCWIVGATTIQFFESFPLVTPTVLLGTTSSPFTVLDFFTNVPHGTVFGQIFTISTLPDFSIRTGSLIGPTTCLVPVLERGTPACTVYPGRGGVLLTYPEVPGYVNFRKT